MHIRFRQPADSTAEPLRPSLALFARSAVGHPRGDVQLDLFASGDEQQGQAASAAVDPVAPVNLAGAIAGFSGPHRFLSNFWSARVLYGAVAYPSVENAYQAAKSVHWVKGGRCGLLDDVEQAGIFAELATCTAGQAKRIGRRLLLRPDWEEIKLEVMRDLIAQKFAPGTKLAQLLLDTLNSPLIEDNTWGDVFWGVCKGRGLNHLGRLLMAQRQHLKQLDMGQLQLDVEQPAQPRHPQSPCPR